MAEASSGSEHPPVHKFRATKILLAVLVLIFIWYVFADRITPYTASARLQAFVIPVVPEVSGYITEIPVKKYELAQNGDTLLQIDPYRYELAVQSAEAALEVAAQDVGAGSAEVASATARMSQARVALDESLVQGQRVFTLEERGVMSAAQGDEARALIATRRGQLQQAEADLEQAREALGEEGQNNPRILYAMSQLEQARDNLASTTIRAHEQGFVGSLYVDEGAYATAGQPVMTFISVQDIWVEAYLTENNLANVTPGDKVEIAFDAYPGRIFKGKVKKTAPGVSTGKTAQLGELSTAKATSAWMRSPQRFSVIIETLDYEHDVESKQGLRLNSQADVIVYTGDGFFWNTLGKGWIRLMTLLSFLY